MRNLFILPAVAPFALYPMMAGPAAPSEDRADTAPAPEIHVVDEVGVLNPGDLDEDSTLDFDVEGMEEYDMLALLIDGDWVDEEDYDQSVYDYVSQEQTDIDGISSSGLDDDTILLTISPESRYLGVYGGDDVHITENIVSYTISDMEEPAQDGDWIGTIETGYESLAVSMGYADPPETEDDSEDMGTVPWIIAYLMLGVGVAACAVALVGAVVKRVFKVRRTARERMEKFDEQAGDRIKFWEELLSVSRGYPAAVENAGIDRDVAEEHLEKTRKAYSLPEGKEKTDLVAVCMGRRDPYPEYRQKFTDLKLRHQIGDWRTSWVEKVNDAEKRISSARESITELKDVASSRDAVDEAHDITEEAHRRVLQTAEDVYQEDMKPVDGASQIDEVLQNLRSEVKRKGESITLRDDIDINEVYRRRDTSHESSYSFYAAVMLAYTSSHSAYSSSYSDFSGYSPTPFTSGGGFTGGSGRF